MTLVRAITYTASVIRTVVLAYHLSPLATTDTMTWQEIFGDVRPNKRYGHSAVVYRGSMYIFGGYDDFGLKCNDLWQLDFGTCESQLSLSLSLSLSPLLRTCSLNGRCARYRNEQMAAHSDDWMCPGTIPSFRCRLSGKVRQQSRQRSREEHSFTRSLVALSLQYVCIWRQGWTA